MRCACASLLLLASLSPAAADGPKDNIADNVRKIPPPGIKVPDDVRKELAVELKKLQDAIKDVNAKATPEAKALLPDVEVYEKAVRYALEHDEFFNAKEFAVAKQHLATGLQRAVDLLHGKHPWTTQTGLVVRGYRSKIDGSAQPYGLVIPKDFDFKKKSRLDFWCHGRGETLTELAFIQQRQSSPGEFASDKAIVLHLYGRYCNANKFAGEVDCFEALDHAKKFYPIDENRLVMRGFSMGGAACWQFAVHYPSVWCAAAPGAGFAETREFLNNFQGEKVQPAWYEQKLWHWYDCTDYALNLYNLPTVAYSGEIDKQKQAADVMERAMAKGGLKLTHIIGPKTGHGYEKGAKAEVIKLIDEIAEKGRNPAPEKIKFVTYTLRYNKCFWISVYGLERHWERAQVEANFANYAIKITTKNVTRLGISIPIKGDRAKGFPPVEVDGQPIKGGLSMTTVPNDGGDTYFSQSFEKKDGQWENATGRRPDVSLQKYPGLQGPIDDAFMDSFLMVRPSGTPQSMITGIWQSREMAHALAHWRQQFRGDAPVKDDKDVTEADIRNSNLILWGDPASNAIIKKIADKLPVKWDADDHKLVLGEEKFAGSTHVPVLIYPNPLNPRKYIVLNSGFTFREYDHLNNARQVPKLPDFAIVDVSVKPDSRRPGKIVTAGFFDEKWALPAAKK
jgi:hypothetical protein